MPVVSETESELGVEGDVQEEDKGKDKSRARRHGGLLGLLHLHRVHKRSHSDGTAAYADDTAPPTVPAPPLTPSATLERQLALATMATMVAADES